MIIILIPAINKIEGELMEWTIIGLNFLYAALGVVLMFLSYKIFDKLSPKIDFEDELKKGNIAVAIFIAALFISIALIIGGALN
jgi:putative membrane protein